MLCLFAHVEGGTTGQVAVYHHAGDIGLHGNVAVTVEASLTMLVLSRWRPACLALEKPKAKGKRRQMTAGREALCVTVTVFLMTYFRFIRASDRNLGKYTTS